MSDLTNDQVVHQLKNHLAVIVGFCDLLLADAPDGDQRTADLREVHKAARQAMAVMADVATRLRVTSAPEQE
jgi:riboflavin biosynthesis pyrimidine reductase